MKQKYIQESTFIEMTEIEKEEALIQNIVDTSEDLEIVNNNFNYATEDLIDYYSYQIKAIQAKLDYLIKIAKKQGITVEVLKEKNNKNQLIKVDKNNSLVTCVE